MCPQQERAAPGTPTFHCCQHCPPTLSLFSARWPSCLPVPWPGLWEARFPVSLDQRDRDALLGPEWLRNQCSHALFDPEFSLEPTLQPTVNSPVSPGSRSGRLKFFQRSVLGLLVGFFIYCFLSCYHVIGTLLSLSLCPFGTMSSRSVPRPPGLAPSSPLAEGPLGCTEGQPASWFSFRSSSAPSIAGTRTCVCSPRPTSSAEKDAVRIRLLRKGSWPVKSWPELAASELPLRSRPWPLTLPSLCSQLLWLQDPKELLEATSCPS